MPLERYLKKSKVCAKSLWDTGLSVFLKTKQMLHVVRESFLFSTKCKGKHTIPLCNPDSDVHNNDIPNGFLKGRLSLTLRLWEDFVAKCKKIVRSESAQQGASVLAEADMERLWSEDLDVHGGKADVGICSHTDSSQLCSSVVSKCPGREQAVEALLLIKHTY